MRKLIVSCGTLSSGGAERVLSILSKSFADRYDEVVYLTWINMPDFYSIDERIKRICVEKECGSRLLIKKIIWFRKWIIAQSPNAILSFLEPFNMMLCLTLLGTKFPIIVSNRTDPKFACPTIGRRLLRWVSYKRANGILFQTEKSRSYFSNYIYRNSSVIYNPVFMPETHIGKGLYTSKNNFIVSVGRLEKVKNQKMIIDAFREFYKIHPDYKLIIYGEGSMRNNLYEHIKKLNLESVVLLPGAVKNIWDHICDAKCFVFTSNYEGMPNALIEAMCLGIPSISTPVAGATDLIDDGRNGLLVNYNDVKSLSFLMDKVVSDNEFAFKLGSNSIKLYDRLKLDVISKEWVDYIDSKISIE